jgi:bifunctional DNA-binding transcriptional regulator/antitoxin component of YhaV-PrlF toxin-antitoxin module
MTTTSISSKAQIVLPAELRRQDRIKAGQEFEIDRNSRSNGSKPASTAWRGGSRRTKT